LAQKISRMEIWRIRKKFERDGLLALKDHKPGAPKQPISPKFRERVVKEWQKQRCGARKLHVILKLKGFGVSLRKVREILVEKGFVKCVPKRRGPKRYKRYEWPLPNLLWHTDWKEFGDKWLIVYLDDHSRKITGHGEFDNATAKNAKFVLCNAIAQNSVPYQLNHDRGTQYYANKRDRKGFADHEFEQMLESLGIIAVPSRAHHPQTNGKCEYFWKIVKAEFDDRFASFDEFVDWYNNERLSEALDYQTPNVVWKMAFKKPSAL